MTRVPALFWLAMAAAGGAAPAVAWADPIQFLRDAKVQASSVRLRDVARLDNLPPALRHRAGDLIVARLQARTPLLVSTNELGSNARRQIPALADWLRDAPDQRILLSRAAPGPVRESAPSPGTCLRLTRTIAQGEAISAAAVEPAACPRALARVDIRYDADQRVARAAEELPPGTVLAPLPPGSVAAIRKGDPVRVSLSIGVVRAERPAVALQDGRGGQRSFVQVEGGEIIAARAPLPSTPEAGR